jgi:hypothetical protein
MVLGVHVETCQIMYFRLYSECEHELPIFGKGVSDFKYPTTVPSLSHHTSAFDIRLEYFAFSSKLV